MAFHGNIEDFLFGSDKGGASRDALERFGITGGGELGRSLEGSIRNDALLVGSSARQSSGQQLARSGLTGSGIAADVLGNADLAQADALRKARFGLINQRIRALLGIAQTPQQEGFIQSGIRAFSAASSSAATAAAGGG